MRNYYVEVLYKETPHLQPCISSDSFHPNSEGRQSFLSLKRWTRWNGGR